ncbi:MAG: 1-deoxy-D-xylulose-5-phosphate reductoisomerase [Actinobacteria bacterium]|nr:1-deoxy-D-xylulose-5-phosphate reductoisomerase [Actinomycetota bacterium]
MASARKRLVVLGSTGSIGTQTLDVVQRHRDQFEILGLACGRNCDLLVQQIRAFGVPQACVRDYSPASDWPAACRRLPYPEGLTELAAHPDADIVVVATVGEAGFRPTEAALSAGNTVALASKELLVMGGALFRDLADRQGAQILPIDSEHSAIWQCLAGEASDAVRRLILTASGGPFRRALPEAIRSATAAQALKHPSWVMGQKVTIDSATLINKGLELIEAHWLFGLPYEKLDAIVHPESVVHSLVEFKDGSMKAQLGAPDMRSPIQYALAYPNRLNGAPSTLDLAHLGRLTFEAPDHARFPLLKTALRAGMMGGTAPAIVCGADEAAVERFLRGEFLLGDLTDAVEDAMAAATPAPLTSLEQAFQAYQWGLEQVRRWQRPPR